MHTPVGAGDNYTFSCMITVFGRDIFRPTPTNNRVVTVNGVEGYYQVGNFENDIVNGIFWPYAERAWANVDCVPAGDKSRSEEPVVEESLDIAQRVHFGVTTTRLPFRLRAMPDGYQIGTVVPRLAGDPQILGGVQFSAADANHPVPYLDIVVSPGQTEVPPGLAGWESDTINGVPAVLSARDGKLCLNLRDHTLCVTSEGGEPADLTTSLWAAGRREFLVGIAKDLTAAKNLNDPTTWFPANDALPS